MRFARTASVALGFLVGALGAMASPALAWAADPLPVHTIRLDAVPSGATLIGRTHVAGAEWGPLGACPGACSFTLAENTDVRVRLADGSLSGSFRVRKNSPDRIVYEPADPGDRSTGVAMLAIGGGAFVVGWVLIVYAFAASPAAHGLYGTLPTISAENAKFAIAGLAGVVGGGASAGVGGYLLVKNAHDHLVPDEGPRPPPVAGASFQIPLTLHF